MSGAGTKLGRRLACPGRGAARGEGAFSAGQARRPPNLGALDMPPKGGRIRNGGSRFLAGGACRAATSPSAWSGRNGPPRTAVAPLYAALLVAARRVPPSTRWGLSRCDKPVRVERTECAAPPARPKPLRRGEGPDGRCAALRGAPR